MRRSSTLRVESISFTSATREAARADLDERPRQAADHLPEEVRRADPEEEEVGRLGRRLEAREPHLDESRIVSLGVLAEAAEVVPAGEEVRGGLHGLRVEAVLDPPDVALAERRAAPRDAVAVDALPGVVARVERPRRRREVEDVDVRREAVVEACRIFPSSRGGALNAPWSEATCANAWTPASVRPAPFTLTSVPRTSRQAA